MLYFLTKLNILAFRIVGVKKNYSTKEIGFFFVFFFLKRGVHMHLWPPPPPPLPPQSNSM